MNTSPTGENIRPLLIQDEMKDSYLKYAMSVIVSRALPDVRDGLKPSQRRILYAMHELNLRPGAKHRKCAKIAGDASGNFHPHGEQVVYPTLVRMGQDFSMRYLLVDPQGNFGSVDGDPPAAMRYTEARLAGPAAEMLEDIEKNTVDFVENYDGTNTEPTVLPGKFPNLLVNGASGIAVGMASSIPPHNLREVTAALTMLVRNPGTSLLDVLSVLPGPDFPTGGLVGGRASIYDAYSTGRGQLVMRGRTEIEEKANGRESIIITEIPYNLNKTRLIEKIAECVRTDRIPGISGVNDESDRNGMRIVVDLKRGEDARVVLNNLYEHTPLQETFSVIMIALVDGRPQTLPLLDVMRLFIEYRIDVIRRRTRFLLDKAEARAHILEGLLKALDVIDEVIETIRSSPDVPTARMNLVGRFGFTEIQADAILEMRLSRLTALERDKIEKELGDLREKIAEYKAILADERLVRDIIVNELEEMAEKYGDARRTEITDEVGSIFHEDLIAHEQAVVTVSHEGYVKRCPLDTYRTQGRGGRGVTGAELKDGDFVEHLFMADTHDMILFFTDRGKVHWLKVYMVPEFGRASRGRPLVNLLELDKDEKVSSVVPVKDFAGERYVFTATERGTVKKTILSAYARPMKGGIIALGMDEGDRLIGVRITSGKDDVILGTANGKAIRFHETGVRPMGRPARGVRGIRLAAGDRVVDFAIVGEGTDLLTACEKGYGKRTDWDEYRIQSRGGQGLINIRTKPRNGPVVGLKAVSDENDLILMTETGMVVRISAAAVPRIGRATQGVRLIRLKEDDRLVSVARVEPEEAEAAAPPAPLPAAEEDDAEISSEEE